ncbi:hypothetical protein RvY_18532-1 [Ramazzottius varieornatus]|uniref:Uncharacterized protein n=1 Tax=Ramazzottius varieornatus TaxID=947166 RepID=A0A1D1W9C2_RAMVA|nr:hypothetical protein RvY_18532-1 [Ramazzottius varieornatus]
MAEVEVSTEHVQQEDRSDDGRLVIDEEAHIERVTGRVSAEFTNKAAPTATKEDNDDKDDTSGASPIKRGHGRPAKGAANGAMRSNKINTAQTSQPRSKAKEPELVDCSEDEDLEEDDNRESANEVFKDAVFHSTAAVEKMKDITGQTAKKQRLSHRKIPNTSGKIVINVPLFATSGTKLRFVHIQ